MTTKKIASKLRQELLIIDGFQYGVITPEQTIRRIKENTMVHK